MNWDWKGLLSFDDSPFLTRNSLEVLDLGVEDFVPYESDNCADTDRNVISVNSDFTDVSSRRTKFLIMFRVTGTQDPKD